MHEGVDKPPTQYYEGRSKFPFLKAVNHRIAQLEKNNLVALSNFVHGECCEVEHVGKSIISQGKKADEVAITVKILFVQRYLNK